MRVVGALLLVVACQTNEALAGLAGLPLAVLLLSHASLVMQRPGSAALGAALAALSSPVVAGLGLPAAPPLISSTHLVVGLVAIACPLIAHLHGLGDRFQPAWLRGHPKGEGSTSQLGR